MKELFYPHAVARLADLPDGLRQLAEHVLDPNQAVNTIVVIPRHTQTQLKRQHSVPLQALAFTATGVLHVQEAPKASQPPTATYLASADLLYAHHSLILLYGRLELGGAIRGDLARVVVEYNTVGQRLLQPALSQFLALPLGSSPAADRRDDQTEALLGRLRAQSLKFCNGLRLYALQPDEQLLGYTFQPRRVAQPWRLLYRVAAPATLLALTDRAVIFIEEEERVIQGKPHGWLITICPRQRIEGIDVKAVQERREVCVRLTRDNVVVERRVAVEEETARAWEALWLEQSLLHAS